MMNSSQRRHLRAWRFLVLVGSIVLAMLVCLALASCGASAPSGAAGTVTTRTVSLTPQPSATAETLPSVTPVAGQITVSLDKDQYHVGDLAVVTVANGLAHSISTTDHRSSCSIVQLEQSVNGGWQAVDQCRSQMPTQVIDIAADSAVVQKIGLPAVGLYRVEFFYGQSVYSSTFTVH
jgi:hypothetical protein